MAVTYLQDSEVCQVVAQSSVLKAGSLDIFDGPCTLYSFWVNNVATSHAACYLKFFNTGTYVDGTTEPDFVFYIADSALGSTPLNLPAGITFSNCLTIAAATTGGKTNTANPAGVLSAHFVGKRN